MSTLDDNKGRSSRERGQKAVDKVLDAATDTLTDLAIDYAIKAIGLIPNAVNWIGNEIKEKISSKEEKKQILLRKEFEESFKAQFEMMTFKLIDDCREIGSQMGEDVKEHFMTEAMKKNGLSLEQIELIKKDANTLYYETAKLLERDSKM